MAYPIAMTLPIQNKHKWSDYEVDRGYILRLLGYSRFECDSLRCTDWKDLPADVQRDVSQYTGITE